MGFPSKVKHNIFTGIFLVAASVLFAQPKEFADKLNKMGDGDTNKAILYIDISNYYYNNGNYDSSILYGMQGFRLAQKQNYVRGIYKNLNLVGLSMSLVGRNNEAIRIFNMGKAYSFAGANKKGEATMLNGLGICETRKGNYKQAIGHYLASLKIEEELGRSKTQIANLNNNIGVVYSKSGDKEQARRYYRTALVIRLGLLDSAAIALSYNNLSNTYSYQNKENWDSVFIM